MSAPVQKPLFIIIFKCIDLNEIEEKFSLLQTESNEVWSH